VVVADHGARVYGSQSIPVKSHEIPLLIVGPAVVKAPARPGVLGGSTDVAPTVLGLIGRPYESLFFGQDLLHCAENNARVFVNHNRDIGMLTANRLVVLGLKRTAEFYSGNPKTAEMTLLPHPEGPDLRLARDAVSFFQVADDLYTHRQYHIDPK
jgi:arylsulfatase A-like enzyme